MGKRKRKLTAAEKAAKQRQRKEYTTIFINGKPKRVKRTPTIDGMDVDEFICPNADPIWLTQNVWAELYAWELARGENDWIGKDVDIKKRRLMTQTLPSKGARRYLKIDIGGIEKALCSTKKLTQKMQKAQMQTYLQTFFSGMCFEPNLSMCV